MSECQKRGTLEIKVKICGLSRLEDIEYVNKSRPDYIGFVFAKKSRRFVTLQEAAVLRKQLNSSIQAVGVFVQEDPQIIAGLIKEKVIDIVQLHGEEDEDYIAKLRQLTDCPVIQAFKIQNKDDFIKATESTADYLLFDSPRAGSGQVFDWSLLTEIERPYFLAGGLSPENIKEALAIAKPYGVDVSSGVETEGKKDEEKIKQFIQSVRDYNRKENTL